MYEVSRSLASGMIAFCNDTAYAMCRKFSNLMLCTEKNVLPVWKGEFLVRGICFLSAVRGSAALIFVSPWFGHAFASH